MKTWKKLPGYWGNKKLNKRQIFSTKLEKNLNFIKKCLEFDSIDTENHALFFPLDHGIGFLTLGQLWKADKNFRKTLKKMQILSKNATSRDIKMLKIIPMLLETMQRHIIKP